MPVKKAYTELLAFLNANADKKIKTVLGDIETMCSAKSAGGVATTVHRNEAGEIVLVRCSYHKLWMPISHVEFGAKAGSASGLNPMCKTGVSNWTKAQRDARKAKEGILTAVTTGEMQANEVSKALETIEATRLAVIPRIDGIGWETTEEALAVSSEDLDAMVEAAKPEEVEEAENQEAA